jgi:hypothetical protein
VGGGGKRFTLSTTSFDSRFEGVGLLQLRLKQTRKYGCSICQSPSGLFVLVTLLLIVLVSSTHPYLAVRIATVPRPVRPSHLPSVASEPVVEHGHGDLRNIEISFVDFGRYSTLL